ncbi:MAG TPA: alanine racemase [Candidatus Limnocylindria bacterium]
MAASDLSTRAAAAGGLAHELSTPALLVDLDIFEANVAAMSALLRGSGKTVRPHIKTHRTPELARRQLVEGAVGVTCATVGEAEAMVAAGIRDVLVANEVVDPRKLVRLAGLAREARVGVAVDAQEPVASLSEAASAAGVSVDVLIDVDVVLHRCGVTSAGDAARLAAAIDRAPGVRLRGLMGYEGRMRQGIDHRAELIAGAYQVLSEARQAVEQAGFPVEVVSAAGTSTLVEAIADPTITEIQAGVYAIMEPELLDIGLPFQCAAAVRGTVISRRAGHVVLDVGRRAVGMEYGPPRPIGIEATDIMVSDEHVRISVAGEAPPLGAQLDLVPGQIRTTFNLHDDVWLSRGGHIVDRWPISARGMSR